MYVRVPRGQDNKIYSMNVSFLYSISTLLYVRVPRGQDNKIYSMIVVVSIYMIAVCCCSGTRVARDGYEDG